MHGQQNIKKKERKKES